jgi:alpha-glucosidase
VLRRFAAAASDGWACWAFSNHDAERHASRWGLGEAELRIYLALLLCLRGSVCLYQGEELGLTEAYVPYEELQDPYGKRFWPKYRGRDGCRTPMVWIADTLHGGFTEGRPWLPVAMEHLRMSVSVQDRDPRSMLGYYRRMLAWRKQHPALVKGDFRLAATAEGYVAFVRSEAGQEVFCAFNLTGADQQVPLPEGRWELLGGTGFEGHQSAGAPDDAGTAYLPPLQAFFAQRVRD